MKKGEKCLFKLGFVGDEDSTVEENENNYA